MELQVLLSILLFFQNWPLNDVISGTNEFEM